MGQKAINFALDLRLFTLFDLESGGHDDRAGLETPECAITKVELVSCDLELVRAGPIENVDVEDDVLHFAHTDSGIHGEPTAECARNSGCELQSGQ